MDGFQGVHEDQINIKIYICYTALVLINRFPLKEIATAWKKMHPATTYSFFLQNAKHLRYMQNSLQFSQVI